MEPSRTAERRKHPRYPLATAVQFYHGPSRREYPARSVDISAGGILLHVPAATPVAPGHPVTLRLGSPSRPEFARLSDQALDATIVRVARSGMLSGGHLPVGVRFAEPP